MRYVPIQLSSRIFLGVAILAALAVSLSVADRVHAQTVSGKAIVEYSRDPATLLVSLTELPSEVGSGEPGYSVEIHADGRVAVHFPRTSKRGGDYALTLDPSELEQLMRSLVAKRFVEFDAPEVRAKQRSLAAVRRAAIARGEVSRDYPRISDPSTIVIELRLDAYRPPDGSGAARAVAKMVSWSGLRFDAQQYTELGELQDLAAIQAELEALMQHPDLERVGE